MTIYPDWIKIPCPVCNAKPYEPCTAVFNLPKGTTMRVGHGGRIQAWKGTTTEQEIRNTGEILSSKFISDGSKSD